MICNYDKNFQKHLYLNMLICIDIMYTAFNNCKNVTIKMIQKIIFKNHNLLKLKISHRSKLFHIGLLFHQTTK